MSISLWKPEPNVLIHQALGKACEEATELAGILARCLIQGLDQSEPATGQANRKALSDEIADLDAAVQWLRELTGDEYDEERADRKLRGFREWQRMLEADMATPPPQPNLMGEPFGAVTYDLTCCEHFSRDVALIKKIAAAGSNGPTEVIYLYAAPAPMQHVLPVELNGVAAALEYGKGLWRTCTGCHESNEGYPTGPYSTVMKCHLGGGCFECGGIGAIWDMIDYENMGRYLAQAGWEAEEKLTLEEAWTTLCETPDITSPEEYPDHALITMEQLGSFMARALPPAPQSREVGSR